MAERKVLNKYYPPDFDPSKLRRPKKMKQQQQIKVRSMLSMSIRCKTCGNYMSRGTKFNSRKEKVVMGEGDKYLGCIQKYRLYSKCTRCSAEFSIITDPQNSDYIVESGATRNFEAYYYNYNYNDEKRKREEADQEDGMQSLEHKALDSKREMDIISSLDEMISMKARRATLTDQDALLQSLHRTKKLLEEEEKEKDEALIKSIIFRNKSPRTTTTCTTPSTLRNIRAMQQPPNHDGLRQPPYKFVCTKKPRLYDQQQPTALQSLVQNYEDSEED